MLNYSQNNLESFFKLLAKHPEAELKKYKGYKVISTNRSSWPNLIYDFLPNVDNEKACLKRLVQMVDEESLPTLLMTNPIRTPRTLIQFLDQQKMKKSQWIAMTIKLDKSQKMQMSDGLKVKKVVGEDEMQQWCAVAEVALMDNKELNHSLYHRLSKEEDIFFYLGYYKGKAVATSMLFMKNGVAGIYLVATLKAYRGKGFGTNMTSYALKTAKESVCLTAMLQATALGKGVYEKIGFKEMGKIDVYRLV